MADYYTLIRQAVQRSDSRTSEARRAIYERARTALLRQLRGHDPPLSDEEISRQRGSLEEAIKKVESEMEEAAVRDGTKSLGKEMASPPLRKARETAPPPPSARPPRARPEPPRREAIAAADEEAEAEGPEAAPPPRARRPGRPSESPAAPPPPEASGRPLRPNPLKERIAPASRSGGAYGAAAEARHEEDEPPEEGSNVLAAHFGRATAETRAVEPEPERDRRDDEDDYYDDEYDDDDYDDDDEDGRERRIGGPAFMIGGVVVVLAILGFAFWQRDTVTQMFVGTPEVATIDADVAGEGGEVPAKSEERVPQPGVTDGSSADPAGQPADAAAKGMPEGETTVASTSPAPPADATIPAGHRSVLYEEGNPGEGGFAYNGRVTWSTEPDETAAGGALLVRGLVNIPQRGMKLLLTMRKNTDQSLPASHIIELLFEVPTSFTSAGIKNVPGILMKANEPTKGTALAGASKRATENYFLIGLSNAPNDLQRNLDLLRDRSWIDVPILYSNNKRAILTIEKGPDGKRIFAEAFASWTGQASSQPAQPSFVQPATSQGTQ